MPSARRTMRSTAWRERLPEILRASRAMCSLPRGGELEHGPALEPGRRELRPRGDQGEQGQPVLTFGKAFQQVETGNVEPMRVFDDEKHRLACGQAFEQR